MYRTNKSVLLSFCLILSGILKYMSLTYMSDLRCLKLIFNQIQCTWVRQYTKPKITWV